MHSIILVFTRYLPSARVCYAMQCYLRLMHSLPSFLTFPTVHAHPSLLASPSLLLPPSPCIQLNLPYVYTTSVNAFNPTPSFAISSLIRNRSGISTIVPRTWLRSSLTWRTGGDGDVSLFLVGDEQGWFGLSGGRWKQERGRTENEWGERKKEHIPPSCPGAKFSATTCPRLYIDGLGFGFNPFSPPSSLPISLSVPVSAAFAPPAVASASAPLKK